MRRLPLAASLLSVLPVVSAQETQPSALHDTPFSAEVSARVAWRTVGPSNMGGRVTDLEVPRNQPGTIYAGTGGGGVWKSTSHGTAWEPVFTEQPVASIGDIATAPSNPNIVWVGTGEENARNSVQWGDGVYKSMDAGKTWKHMGLSETFQIGHVAIHPKNPEIVYVAALGKLWSYNDERGVFRTRDGGQTWQKVLFVDHKTGCMDVRIDPDHPDTIYAVMYERLRDIYDSNDPVKRFGKGSGLYRSDDGGNHWQKLTKGLPSCTWGRCGISIYDKRPTTLFAIIETERSGWASGTSREGDGRARPRGTAYLGAFSEDGENGALVQGVAPDSPATKAGIQEGDLITKVGTRTVADRADLDEAVNRAIPDEKAKVTLSRAGQPVEVEVTFVARPRGGQGGFGPAGTESQPSSQPGSQPASQASRPRQGGPGGFGGPGGMGSSGMFGGRLGGQQANVQDAQGEQGHETGGVFRSDDRGETWKRINSLTERPFYYSVIAVDPSDENFIYCVGTSLWQSTNGGETFREIQRNVHVDFHALWIDPHDGDHLLAGCDGGVNVSWDRARTWETYRNLSAGQYYHVAVNNAQPYLTAGGLQDNGTWVVPSRTRYSEGIGWSDAQTVYGGDGFGACFDPEDDDVLFCTSQNGALGMINLKTGARRSVQRPQGVARWNWDTPFFLSPHSPRVLYFAGNKACRSLNRGARSEAISDELCLTPGGSASAMAESPMLPGLLYVGTDDGALWRTKDAGKSWQKVHDKLPTPPRYVSAIHPSRFKQDRVYVACDGHRFGDFQPHVYVSEDAGDTWTSLGDDLPANMPVHVCREDSTREDLLWLGAEFGAYASFDRGQHWLPLGTGLPTVAVRDLVFQNRDQDLVAATHGRGVWICDIAPLRQVTKEILAKTGHLFAPENVILWRMRGRGSVGHKELYFPNPPNGATFYVHLRQRPENAPAVTIHDVTGTQVGSVTGRKISGMQAIAWTAPRNLKPGAYAARCKIGEETQVQAFQVLADPADEMANISTSEGR